MPRISPAEYQRRLQTLLNLSQLQKIAEEEILKEEPSLTRIKKEEFLSGLNPDGTAIGRYRNAYYARRKAAMNPMAGGRVDLTLTGAYSNSAFVKSLGAGKFRMGFRDFKAPFQTKRYGMQIEGINQQSFDQLQLKIRPRYWERLKRQANIS